MNENEIKFHNLKDKSIEKKSILTDEEIYVSAKIYKAKNDLFIIGIVYNKVTQDEIRQVHKISNEEIKKINTCDITIKVMDLFDISSNNNRIAYYCKENEEKRYMACYGYKDLESGIGNWAQYGECQDIKINPDGRYIMLYSETYLYIKDEEKNNKFSLIESIQYANWIDSERIVIFFENSEGKIINIETGEKTELKSNLYNIKCVKFIPNNNILCISGILKLKGDNRHSVELITIKGLHRTFFLDGHNDYNLKISPKGKNIASINDNSIIIWNNLSPEILELK